MTRFPPPSRKLGLSVAVLVYLERCGFFIEIRNGFHIDYWIGCGCQRSEVNRGPLDEEHARIRSAFGQSCSYILVPDPKTLAGACE